MTPTRNNVVDAWRKDFLSRKRLELKQDNLVYQIIQKLENNPPYNEHFLHALCKKIDVSKKLFVSYTHDLKRVLTEKECDDEGWEGVLLLLTSSFTSINMRTLEGKALGYKLINSLLKARDLISQNLCNKTCTIYIYHDLIPQLLSE